MYYNVKEVQTLAAHISLTDWEKDPEPILRKQQQALAAILRDENLFIVDESISDETFSDGTPYKFFLWKVAPVPNAVLV